MAKRGDDMTIGDYCISVGSAASDCCSDDDGGDYEAECSP